MRQVIAALRAPGVALRTGIILFALLLVTAIWLSAYILVAQDRATQMSLIEQTDSNLTRVLEEHAIRTLDYIDTAAIQAKRRYEQSGMKFDLAGFFRESHFNRDLLINIVITNESGLTVLSSDENFTPANLADREHFKVHIAQDTNRPFIGKPIKARLAGQRAFVLTRRINKPDGSFGGTVGVAVDPLYFSEFYRLLSLGNARTINLTGLDGIVRAVVTDSGRDIGSDLSASPAFELAKTSAAGTYFSHSLMRPQSRRVYTYRVIRGYPLMINVGIEESVAFAGVRLRKDYYYGVALIASLVVLVAALWLFSLTRRQTLIEAELARLNAQLEARVAERTARLELVNRELSAFSYSVAHDLRTPLRSIIGFSSLVMEACGDKLDPKSSGYLQRIVAAGTHMGALIEDLLRLSRISRQELNKTAVDVSGLAAQVLAGLVEANPQRSVQVLVQPGIDASADRPLLLIVLENLLGNAWKFTARNPAAKIEFFALEKDHRPAYCVRDNGAGFDMQYAAKLFEPFHRLHSADEFEGSGIGLATVRNIVERHGGKVWAESVPGEGTSIYFSLG